MDGLRSLDDDTNLLEPRETISETPSIVEPLAPASPITLNVQGVSTNNGNLIIAGRDVVHHNHYHGSSGTSHDVTRITSALLKVPNLRKVYLDILAKATPGTGIWLFKIDQWFLWLNLNGRIHILWGTGIPGAGKSVLASIVIKELEAHAAQARGNICVAYLFIRYSDAADVTIRSFLEVLLKQTVERHADCAAIAAQVYARHMAEDTQPTEAELIELLQQCIATKAGTFYIIDALDEAPDKLQLDLIKKLASLNARLFITSRPLRTVEARAPDAYRFAIAAQDQDLDLHIAQGIDCSPDLQVVLEQDPSLREEAVSSIKRNCGGMFLHASLQLEVLCQSVSMQDVRETLDSFPQSIEDVYLQTWKRIHSQSPKLVALAKAVLIWVINASRSMKLKELECAVAAPFSTCKFEPGRVVAGSTLLSLCRGLVVFEEESCAVRLVHYTAKDILESLLNNAFPYPHSLLAKVCVSHLTACNFQNTTIASEEELKTALIGNPLLAYASDAWAFHASFSLDDEDARRRTSEFITGCHAFPALVLNEMFDILSPLHTLARYNLPLFLLGCDIGNPNVATPMFQLTSLTLASWYGHTDFIRELLKQSDVLPNATNGSGDSPLILAAYHGFEEVVTLFLSHPDTDVNLVDRQGNPALAHVAWKGNERLIVILLSQNGIDVNLANGNIGTPLIRAVRSGMEGTVKLLLAHPGINVNAVDWLGKSALCYAAERGYEGIATLLLASHGIQVNMMDRRGWSALHWAVDLGQRGIVRALLACPDIDVNVSEPYRSFGHTALILAIKKGHDELVAMLLTHPDIQVNYMTGERMSALMYACMEGQAGATMLLLGRDDVDVNLVDYDGDTALILAVDHGHESLVRLLVADSRLDISVTRYCDGNTALSLAIARGLDGIVKLFDCVFGATTSADPFPDLEEVWMAWEDGRDEAQGEETCDSEGSELFEDAEEWIDDEEYGRL